MIIHPSQLLAARTNVYLHSHTSRFAVFSSDADPSNFGEGRHRHLIAVATLDVFLHASHTRIFRSFLDPIAFRLRVTYYLPSFLVLHCKTYGDWLWRGRDVANMLLHK